VLQSKVPGIGFQADALRRVRGAATGPERAGLRGKPFRLPEGQMAQSRGGVGDFTPHAGG